MDFKKAKAKKFAPYCNLFPLPVKTEKPYIGVFNGYNVTISDFNEITDVYFMGNFGKGSLSKSTPNYHTVKDDMPNLVFEQQWENQSKWNCLSIKNSEKFLSFYKFHHEKAWMSLSKLLESALCNTSVAAWSNLDCKSIHDESDDFKTKNMNLPGWLLASDDLPSNFSEGFAEDPIIELTENILKRGKIMEKKLREENSQDDIIVVNAEVSCLDDAKPRMEKDNNLIRETLTLNLEEAFFLYFALGCLIVKDLNNMQLTVADIWKKFSAVQHDFITNYVAYHYYRSKGWVVKSGLKYGGDYLLYKKGPAYYHANYLIHVVDGNKKFSWNELTGMNRLVETFNKDLLLCYVIQSEDMTEEDLKSPEALQKFFINECVVRRWLPTQERNLKN